eukprot:2832704-Amphidinium_carterae.1
MSVRSFYTRGLRTRFPRIELPHAPAISPLALPAGQRLIILEIPSSRVIRNHTPQPDQTRPPEFTPGFELYFRSLIRCESEAIRASDGKIPYHNGASYPLELASTSW